MAVISSARWPNTSFCHNFGPRKLLNAISRERFEGGKLPMCYTGSCISSFKMFILTWIVNYKAPCTFSFWHPLIMQECVYYKCILINLLKYVLPTQKVSSKSQGTPAAFFNCFVIFEAEALQPYFEYSADPQCVPMNWHLKRIWVSES